MKYDDFERCPSGITRAWQDKKKRNCKICKVELSKYNHGNYCFNHIIEGINIEYEKRREKNRNAAWWKRRDDR